MEEKMKKPGKTGNELSWLAQDRAGRRSFVDDLCSSGNEQRIDIL